MDISKRLYRYPSLMDEVEDLKSQIDGIMVERYNVKVTSTITGMPGGGKTSDPVYQTVEKIVGDYDTKLLQSYKKINELLEEHNAISMALWKLDLDQRKIIEMRFFECRKWQEIQRTTHFSRTQCYRILKKSVDQLQTFLEPVGKSVSNLPTSER